MTRRHAPYRLVAFTFAWLVFAGIVLVTRPSAFVAVPLLFVGGFVALRLLNRGETADALRRATGKSALVVALRNAGATTVLACASIVVTIGYQWITWDPIGAISDDGWGNPFPLIYDEFPQVSNRAGLTTTIRRSRAPYGEEGATYYIFVHSMQDGPNSDNLVFRYDSTSAAYATPPNLKWNGDNLTVSVGNDQIYQVTKLVRRLPYASVTYELRRATWPPALRWWQRSPLEYG